MLMIKNIKHKYQQRAIGLIETLSTLIIVSFGVLGLATLEIQNTTAINNNISSLKAAIYAGNLVQKLIDNKTLARSTSSPYILSNYTSTPPTAATSPICITSTCTTSQLASYDLTTWLYELHNDLPSGQAQITVSTTGSSFLYNINIQWVYKSQTNTYTTVTQL